VTWARDWFEETFTNIPKAILTHRQSPSFSPIRANSVFFYFKTFYAYFLINYIIFQDISDLDELFRSITEPPNSFDDCVIWARKKWQNLFHDEIIELVKTYPKG